MIISLIVAMGENGVIGDKGKMPWGEKPIDGKRFVTLTRAKPIIIGRKTFESIFEALGGPLPQRTNIILTRDHGYAPPGCIVAHSPQDALFAASSVTNREEIPGEVAEVMIAGGAEIYRLFLPYADKIYRTLIQETFSGDTYFPLATEAEWEEWRSIKSEKEVREKTEHCPWKVTFETFERKNKIPRPDWLRGLFLKIVNCPSTGSGR